MKKHLIFFLTLVVFFGIFGKVSASNEDLLGRWKTLSFITPINPVHAALLPRFTIGGDKILIIGGSENNPANTTFRGGILDLATGVFKHGILKRDLFCNGMGFLPDGRMFIAGGTKTYNPFIGERSTTIFDENRSGLFFDGPTMAEGRWYPTVTSLSDGKLMLFSGLYDGEINNTVEFLTPATRPNAGTLSKAYQAPFVPELYPRMHLLPNGTVFYSGPSQSSHFFNPAAIAWGDGPPSLYGVRTYGTSVLLPLLPENEYKVQVLIFGGGDPVATNTAELINLSGPFPFWQYVGAMNEARIQLNGTLLPDGTILATGGSKINEDRSMASLSAEIFNPKTESWTAGASERYPRLYHSVAVLLSDGSVLVAGSNPDSTYEKRLEVYYPSYFFVKDSAGKIISAPRPVIRIVPRIINYGKSFHVSFSDTRPITAVRLVRPSAVTHGFNMSQTVAGLTFSSTTNNGVLNVFAPQNGSIAPPGYYMLFLIHKDINGKEIPSIAKFVQLQ